MEIESFTQCLDYLASTGNGKATIGWITPIVASLSGIVIGFGLNLLRDKVKSNNENSNKAMCISEDIERIRIAAGHVFRASIEYIDPAKHHELVKTYSVTSAINSPYIDKHFMDIAHLHSKDQRHNMVALLPCLNDMNTLIKSLSNPSTPSDRLAARRNCVKVANLAVFCFEQCDAFLKEPSAQREDWISIGRRLNIDPEVIINLTKQGKP